MYYQTLPKHLDSYISEFTDRYHVRQCYIVEQMERIAAGMDGRRLG